tara:strand:- start:224 stop:463 length:240 start_codon:yes stop_codon:yes gene_type:complete
MAKNNNRGCIRPIVLGIPGIPIAVIMDEKTNVYITMALVTAIIAGHPEYRKMALYKPDKIKIGIARKIDKAKAISIEYQ